ncbi:MAG TPA: hypothetical protein VNA28_03855 [Solirubrobacteraceae bacterium]|nr:hypothetical protein [Solirubrobacteraceae bacterium]
MPRVKVKLPDGLLQKAATRADELGVHIDALWSEAISAYVEQNKDMRADAVRSRAGIPRSSPTLTVEVPEELFQRAEKLLKRIGKQRDWLYCEALAKHVAYNAAAGRPSDGGHTLPNETALRPKRPA